jgi:Amt family ammonium transporter
MINGADTAWVLTATVLVLFMTLPGLALFYAGLVRAKNTDLWRKRHKNI